MNVSVEQMKERTRKQPIALTRQVLCYFLFKYGPSSLTLSEIGNAIGGRDHATVLYSLRIVKERVEVDKKFKAHLLELENSFIKYFPNSIPRE
jgi:chromosomal replication initiator protein